MQQEFKNGLEPGLRPAASGLFALIVGLGLAASAAMTLADAPGMPSLPFAELWAGDTADFESSEPRNPSDAVPDALPQTPAGENPLRPGYTRNDRAGVPLAMQRARAPPCA